MFEPDFLDRVEAILKPLGARLDNGEEYEQPPLMVLRYFIRPVRLSRLPILGRSLSVVAVIRQPADLGTDRAGLRFLQRRVGQAVDVRFPPWRRRGGLSIGLTLIVLTDARIQPEEETTLADAMKRPTWRTRSVTLGLFRVCLDQDAYAFSLAKGPDGLYPEPLALADGLSLSLGRFVPRVEF